MDFEVGCGWARTEGGGGGFPLYIALEVGGLTFTLYRSGASSLPQSAGRVLAWRRVRGIVCLHSHPNVIQMRGQVPEGWHPRIPLLCNGMPFQALAHNATQGFHPPDLPSEPEKKYAIPVNRELELAGRASAPVAITAQGLHGARCN